jgi:hypothetical protein
MQISAIINEIRSFKDQATHRSTSEICRLLGNNKTLFTSRMDPDDFRMLLNDFSEIDARPAKEYGSAAFKRDYEKSYNLLMFYLDKFI